MAEIEFPPNVKVESISLGLEYPGQEVLTSVFTGTRQVLLRNTGYWVGTMVLFPVHNHPSTRHHSREVELFLAMISDRRNTFKIDLSQAKFGSHETTPTNGYSVRENATDKSKFQFRTDRPANQNNQLRRAIGQRLARDFTGAYFSYEGRLRHVTDVTLVQDFDWAVTFNPPVRADVDIAKMTLALNGKASIECVYDSSEVLETVREGDIIGGWTIRFREHVQ